MSVLKKIIAPFTMKRSANDDFRARKATVLKAKRQAANRNKKPTQLKPYRAVSILVGECPCAAVKEVAGKRFLVTNGDAPELPLAGCDAASCGCKYTHHEDRRDTTAPDRRQWSSLRTELFSAQGGDNNRQKKKRGRRKSD